MHAGPDAFAGKAKRPRPNYFGPQRRRAVQMPGTSARYCRNCHTQTDLENDFNSLEVFYNASMNIDFDTKPYIFSDKTFSR
jgi:hypothetical protein